MALKVEIKWLGNEWNAFFPDKVLKSAGIIDIIDQVKDALPPPRKGMTWNFEARPAKFVVYEVDAAAKKMSKSDG